MVLKLLIDTCVWLDLAKDYRDQPVITALEDLIQTGAIQLTVPEIVITEFQRHKARVIEESQRSLQPHFRLVREAVNRFGDDEGKAEVLKTLNKVDHHIATRGEAVKASVQRIETLLHSVPALITSESVKRRVTERAIASRAPYHRNKNSVSDAILIEVYTDLLLSDPGGTYNHAFVTHNVKDFSDPNGDRRTPHPDLAPLFQSDKSAYSVSLVEVISGLDSDLLEEHHFEFTYSQQARRLSEILDAEHVLFRQVWYNRHCSLRHDIENNTVRIVNEDDYSRSARRQDIILDAVWRRALEAAKKTEAELGPNNLGPWDDFEWGMINGKLSALRWVLGDEWDVLDT